MLSHCSGRQVKATLQQVLMLAKISVKLVALKDAASVVQPTMIISA